MIAAVVLAGGASSRMGTDKATLVVDGLRLIDRAIAALVDVASDRIVVAGPHPGQLPTGVLVAPDPPGPRQGPLAGVAAAWAQLDQLGSHDQQIERLIVLSCDLPSVDAELVRQLLAASEAGSDVMATDGERPQPLVAVYRRETVEMLVDGFGKGERSIRHAVGVEQVALVPIDVDRVADADSPSDLVDHDVVWPESTSPR